MNKNRAAAAILSASFSLYLMRKGFFDPNSLPVLLYHDITDEFYWTLSRSTTRMFKNQMKLLANKSYHFVHLRQISAPVSGEPTFSITFDDALISVVKNAFPVLEECGFKAAVFVVTDYAGKLSDWDVNLGGKVKRHMNWDEIAFLAENGWTIGSHSCTHRDLTRLRANEISEEAERSRETIFEKTGIKTSFFSYPFGRANCKISEIIRKSGYECAFSSYSPENPLFDPFRAGRRPVYLFDSAYDVLRRVERSRWKNLPYDFVGRNINFFAGGVGIYKEKIEKCLRN
ncbi:polysaccharide deacetylase family protein [candidate division WOR-3 bacterium]|nr:polysaccharide deacetylase family protein [candidate division WOR-3 bacterium]